MARDGYLAAFRSWMMMAAVAAIALGPGVAAAWAQGQAQQPFDVLHRVGAPPGANERGWEEFATRQDNPVYSFGASPPTDIRGWIGHSDCARCPVGRNQTQRFRMTGLAEGQVYALRITLAHVSSTRPLRATLVEGRGRFLRGGEFRAAQPGPVAGAGAQWTIVFTALSPEIVISVGNDAVSGRHYAYFDAIELQAQRSETAVARTAATADASIVAPPPPPRLLAANGANDFTGAYHLQSIVHHLIVTGDPAWARRGADWASRMLAERNAPGPDGGAAGWLDSSPNVRRPYAWGGFTGHNFAPILHLARVILANPSLAALTHGERPLGEQARRWMEDFDVAFALHADRSLVREAGGRAYLRLPRDLPVGNPRAPGSEYPPNMGATFFEAALHQSCLKRLTGEAEDARRLREITSGFVRHLMQDVIERVSTGGRSVLAWNYSSYIPRREDVGHANVVIRFMLTAHRNGYPVDDSDIGRAAAMADMLMGPDGAVASDLIDGRNFTSRLTRSVYYFILLSRHSPQVRAKSQAVVARSRNFAYQGAWLFATQEPRLREGCM
jgi:hypothetical protein